MFIEKNLGVQFFVSLDRTFCMPEQLKRIAMEVADPDCPRRLDTHRKAGRALMPHKFSNPPLPIWSLAGVGLQRNAIVVEVFCEALATTSPVTIATMTARSTTLAFIVQSRCLHSSAAI